MRIPECATLQHEGGVINDAGLTGYPFRKRSKVGSLPAKEWREVTECEVLHTACVATRAWPTLCETMLDSGVAPSGSHTNQWPLEGSREPVLHPAVTLSQMVLWQLGD